MMIIKKKIILWALSLLWFCPQCAFAQQNAEKAKAILTASQAALKQINQVSYQYMYQGNGKYNGHFSGEASMKGLLPTPNAYVDLRTLKENGETLKREEISISQDQRVTLTDHAEKTYQYGTLRGGSAHLTSYAPYALIWHYVHPAPFQSEIANPSLSYKGDTTISSRQLEMVGVVNQFGDKVIWFIGKEDNMIHAQKSSNTNPEEEGGFFFTVTQLRTNQTIPDKTFHPEAPQGYASIDEDNRELKVGSEAPGWFLPTLDGSSRRAMDYRGKVVVLDFWASWCKPCWQIMPIVNKIQSGYDKDDVQVFGVNVWEKPSLDVAKYLKDKGYDHYETLLDKEARTAKKYKIYSLPLLVVIGRDGKIRYIHNGASGSLEVDLKAAIDKALEE